MLGCFLYYVCGYECWWVAFLLLAFGNLHHTHTIAQGIITNLPVTPWLGGMTCFYVYIHKPEEFTGEVKINAFTSNRSPRRRLHFIIRDGESLRDATMFPTMWILGILCPRIVNNTEVSLFFLLGLLWKMLLIFLLKINQSSTYYFN